MEMPNRFERLLVMNTTLGTGDAPLGEGFLAWRAFSNSKPDMDIAGLMKRNVPSLSDDEAAAYAAPYPDARYKAGVRRFPNLVELVRQRRAISRTVGLRLPDRPDADGAALSRRARGFWNTDGECSFGFGSNVDHGEFQSLRGGTILDAEPRGLRQVGARRLAEDKQRGDWDRF
jgi:hypothetical protein